MASAASPGGYESDIDDPESPRPPPPPPAAAAVPQFDPQVVARLRQTHATSVCLDEILPPLGTGDERWESRDVLPTMNCNWLLYPRLLLGGAPASLEETRALWKLGVHVWVDFREQHEVERNFRYDLALPAGHREHYPCAALRTLSDARAAAVVARLVGELARGHTVFLHCKVGIGRSATIGALLVARLFALDAADAITWLQLCLLTRLNPAAAEAHTPESDYQAAQIHRLTTGWQRERFYRAQIAAGAAAAAATPLVYDRTKRISAPPMRK